MPLVIITTLFGLSLLAAWILFKFLQSSAGVSKPEYQLGGAVAGFVIILSLLSVTYIQIDNRKSLDRNADLQKQVDEANAKLADARQKATDGNACLAREATENVFAGSVSPSQTGVLVVLGAGYAQPQPDGTFLIKSKHVSASDNPSFYVISADSRAPYRQLMEHDDPKNVHLTSSVQ